MTGCSLCQHIYETSTGYKCGYVKVYTLQYSVSIFIELVPMFRALSITRESMEVWKMRQHCTM